MRLSVYSTGALMALAWAQPNQVPLSTCDTCDFIPSEPDVDASTYSDQDALDAIRKALKKADIINEVVDDFTPKCFLAPFYGKKHRSVLLGNPLKPSKTKSPPSLKIYCPQLTGTPGLTIVLTDPDAPSRDDPKWSEMCHWIGVIPVPSQSTKDDGEGEYLELSMASGGEKELVEYKPPGPPPKTGYHRYAFILLQGDNSNLTAPEERQHWGFGKERHGVRDWAKKEGLEVVGANFFVAKNKKQK